MKIELSDDIAEEIVRQSLMQDYISLSRDIKQGGIHPDDVEAYVETVAAIEALGRWYFAPGEFDKAVKKARKEK